MAQNRSQSSSEQYIKRSNRRLLFGGLLLLLVFLVAYSFISGGSRQRVEETPMEYTNEILDDGKTDVTQPNLFARGDAKLRVDPAQIDMNNVVIGSKVEAILTLTAENTPIEFLGMDWAEQQVDGFTLESNCSGKPLEAGSSCTVKVFWNPIALRQLQNNLTIRWKEYSQTSFREQSSIVQVKAQSTDSKDCVICEDIRAKEAVEPRIAMELGGTLYPIDDDGKFVTIDGAKNPITENGVVLKKDDAGLIIGIVEPEYIAVNLNNDVMGTISETKDVIGANGEKIGKMLGDKTIVDTKLNVLGAGIPVVSVIDLQGNVIGKMTKEGTVVDGKNAVIGKVWVDGQVVSLENQPIGYVRPWGLVADFMGKIVGGIIPDGTVIDAQNNMVGKVLPNGFVVSNENGLVGATLPQGVGVGAGCQALGKVLLNGTVKDSFDQTAGKVLADGSIVNTIGETIGSVISQGLVIDEKGIVIGFVNSEGKAVNANGAVIGCVNPDGTILAGKKMIGVVMPRGHVIGYGCQPVGTVFPNGEVYDRGLTKVGRVMPDNYVKNADNNVVGVVVTRTTAIAEGCRFLGIVSITGQIFDLQGQAVGCVSPDKTVINKEGETIGGLSPIGPVYDSEGRLIGRTSYDGKARDKNGKVIGCLNPDGSVTDEKGNTIGWVRQETGLVLDAAGNPTGATVVGRKVFDKNNNYLGELNREGVVVSETGKYVGFIPPDGHIFSPDGLILGRYTSQIGYAVNQNNERFGKVMFDLTVISAETGDIIGGLIPDNSGFIDVNGGYLGQVQADGTLRNANKEIIGAIRGDGSVIDKTGNLVGYRIDEGTVATTRGVVIGTVNKKGIILSPAKTEIGYVIGNGLAISTDGKKVLGGVLPASALAMDATGLIGYLNDKGEIQGLTGEVVGKATPFGLVLAEDGTAVAKLTRLGVFVDKDGKTVGWTSFEGTLTGKNEKSTGKINALGLAFDRANNLLGSMVKRGIVINKVGELVSVMAVNNRVLQKDKILGLGSASSYIYETDSTPLGRIVPAGIAVTNDGDFLGWSRADGTIGTKTDTLGTILFDNRIINKQGVIIGVYVPLGSVAYNDEGKTVGVVDLNGNIVSIAGQKRGKIRGGNLVSLDDAIIGRLLADMPYVSNDVTGKTNGLAQLTGEVVTATSGKPVGNLMLNTALENATRQVLGHEAVMGSPVTNSLSAMGQLYINGLAMRNGKKEGVLSGIKALYNDQGKIVGSVLPVGTVIGKSGNFIGQSAASSQVTGRMGKQTAVQMTHGTALLTDNVWVGGLIPEGVVVNDDAVTLGTIAPDGVVLDKADMVIARALNDGAAARISDRALYNTMPYAGATVMQGLPFGYRGNVIGTTTLNGDVVDSNGEKLFRILDDGTILGIEEPLVGAVLPYITAFSHNGDLLGTLNSQGKLVKSTGETAGKIAVNETVKGKGKYEILGALVPRRTITNECRMVGTVVYTGQVIDARGTVVGRMQPDRWAINSAGEKIGRVTRWGIVISNEGNYIGRTLPDSTVVDKEGVHLGCAQNDGSVVDKDGNVIGGVIERGLVLGKDGKPIGRVKADGSIVNEKGEVIGKILADGTAIDNEGNVIGRLVRPEEELLFDEHGNIIGTLASDGTVRNPQGDVLFRVDKDGNVYDSKGNLIGKYKDDEFFDAKGNPLGSDGPTMLVDKDGNVFGIVSGCDVLNSFGEKIGSILANGNVVDLNGEVYAKILGDGTIMKGEEVMGQVKGTKPQLDKCGIQTISGDAAAAGEGGKSSAVGRAIYIGKQKYDISDTGSIINEDGTVIGYMGDDGKPYTLDGRVLTSSGDEAGRSRPNVVRQPSFTPEQVAQMQDLLTKKRSSMRAGIKNTIKPDGRILAKSKLHRADDWGGMVNKNISSWPVDMSRMILSDKAIPAVIVRSIDSRYKDVPVTAIVERHIYSEKGRNIIIPAGSRVIGKMTGSPGTDKVAKMEISWERLIRPDGGMFKFEAVSGDAQGRGGVAAYLDEQLITKYGKPVLTSVVTSSVAYMMAANDDYTENADTGSTTRSSKSEAVADARESFINAMDTIFQQLIEESTNVPPVVFVPSGTRITIFSKDDLWLRAEEDDIREFEESNGPASTEAQKPDMDSWVDSRQGTGDEDTASTEDLPITSQSTSGSGDSKTETVDYYTPDDSYKAANAGKVNTDTPSPADVQKKGAMEPVYDGSKATVTEDIPLQDRTAAPVLPKTGAASRLF